MDNTELQKIKYLTRRKRNADGSVTLQIKTLKPNRTKTVVTKSLKNVPLRRGFTQNGNKTIGAVFASELFPFRKVMVLGLKKRGYNTDKLNFKTVIGMYHNEFCSNLYDKSNPYVPINVFEFCNNPAFKLKQNDSFNGNMDDIRNIELFDRVSGIVDRIVDIMRTAKLKKDVAVSSGVNPKTVLTDEEMLQAKAAEKVEKDLEAKALGTKPVNADMLKNILIIGLVMYLIIQLMK